MGGENIRAGGAFVELFAKNEKLQAALKESESQLKEFSGRAKQWTIGSAAAIAGGFLATKAAISNAFEQLVTYGDQFDKMAQRTGISVEALSKFNYMAGLCGTNIGAFETGVRTMQKALLNASKGSADLVSSFDALGVDVSKIVLLSPEDQFETLAAAVSKIDDPTKRAALAMKIFGDSGTQLLPLFNAGADGMAQMGEEAKRLGQVVSSDDAAASALLGDELSKLKSSFSGLTRTLIKDSVPSLIKWAESIRNGVGGVIKFVSEHKALISTIAKSAGLFLSAAGAIMVAAKSIAAFTAFSTVLAAHPVAAALVAISVAAIAVYSAFKKANIAVAETKNAMAEIAKKNAATFTQDKSLMGRLEEIANKHHKTNQEIKEAQYIVEKLKGTYGDLGIAVDATTGKITGMTGAMERMQAIQIKAKQDDVKAEIAEIQSNETADQTEISRILKRGAERNKRYSQDGDGLNQFIGIVSPAVTAIKAGRSILEGDFGKKVTSFWSAESGKWISLTPEEMDQLKNAKARSSANAQKIGAKREQLDWLAKGIDEGEVADKAEKGFVPAPDKSNGKTSAQLDAEKFQADFDNRNLDEHQKKIADITKRFDDLEAKRKEELVKEGYSEETASVMVGEEFKSQREAKDALIQEENDTYNAKRERESLEQLNEINKSKPTELKTKLDETLVKIQEETEKYLAARDGGDAKKMGETLKVIDTLEKEARGLEKAIDQEGYKNAGSALKAAGEKLRAATTSGDQNAIITAQKEYNEASDRFATATAGTGIGEDKEALAIAENQRETFGDLQVAANELRKAWQSGDKDWIEETLKVYSDAKSTFESAKNDSKTFFEGRENLLEKINAADLTDMAAPAIDVEAITNLINSGVENAETKYESTGSFSAFAASSVGENNYERKIAENSSEQVRYLRDIYANTKSLNVVTWG